MATARRDTRLFVLALVGAGGFLGATLRYGLAVWVPGTEPLGTLAANVLGSFLLGVLLSEAHLPARLSPETRLLVGTGFCGSLTTYSAFAAETTALAAPAAAGYVGATYALGFAGVVAGQLVARWLS